MTASGLEAELEQELHVSWLIVFYKFSTGLVELSIGLGLIFFQKTALVIYNNLIIQELLEGSHRRLAGLGQQIIPYLFSQSHSLGIFLAIFGLTKLSGSLGLIFKKYWGVDLLVGVTMILLPFQLYNFIFRHSYLDLFYLLLGIFIALYLINFRPGEYSGKIVRKLKNNDTAGRIFRRFKN